MNRTIVLGLALIGVSLHAATMPQTTPPWEWSDEERLARRFDPLSIRERAAARPAGAATSASRVHSNQMGGVEISAAADLPNFISGARNPELFMPFELFSSLIDHGFAVDAKEQQFFRRSLEPVVAQASPK